MDLDAAAFADGVEAAKVDIAAGRRVYRWGGHAGHWGHWIVWQLAERFAVGVSDGILLMASVVTGRSLSPRVD